MIRFLLVCITVIGFLILSIPILIVEWIICKFNPYKKDISSLVDIASIEDELRRCAETVNLTDRHMEEIKDLIGDVKDI